MRLWVQISTIILLGVLVTGSVMYFIPYIQRRSLTGGEVLCSGLTLSAGDIHEFSRLMVVRGDRVYITVLLTQEGGDISSVGTVGIDLKVSKSDVLHHESRVATGRGMTIPVVLGPYYVKSNTPVPITLSNMVVFWNWDPLPCFDTGEPRRV